MAEGQLYSEMLSQKAAELKRMDANDPDRPGIQAQYDKVHAELLKLMPDKESKNLLQQRKTIADYHIGQGPQGAQGGAQQPAGMSPLPAAGTAPSGPPATLAGDSGTPPVTLPPPPSSPAIPPPPKTPDMLDIRAGMAAERQEMADARTQRIKQQESDIQQAREVAVKKAEAEALANKPPATIEAAYLKSFRDEHGREPTTEEIEAHYKGEREKPIDAEVARGIKLAEDGDLEGAKKIFSAVQEGAGAKKGGVTTGTSLMAVVNRANSGDPAAQKDLKTYMAMQNELAMSRGMGFGKGRAMYQIGAYIDGDTGQMIPLSNYDAIQRIREGKNLVPSGRLPAPMIAGAQRLVKEAKPAMQEVRDNLSAYDNPYDRAIFARVMTAAGKPSYGQESWWISNVMNQAATSGLSNEGKALVIRLARLNETIGTLRTTLGAPATDTSMAIMLGLLPGPSTPDSKMAGDMIDQLEQNVTNAVEIPVLKGVSQNKNVPPPPPPKLSRPSANVVVEH
jgi:hypothetical protein